MRVSAILRWNDGILLCRHEKRGQDAGCCPGGGVHAGESLLDALEREIAEEVGIEPPSFEGPVAIATRSRPAASSRSTSSTSSSPGDLGGSLESVASQDAAVHGHRLFALDELDGIVLHPPIQRFLARWRPGDPAVYLGALWTP